MFGKTTAVLCCAIASNWTLKFLRSADILSLSFLKLRFIISATREIRLVVVVRDQAGRAGASGCASGTNGQPHRSSLSLSAQ
jgi:hypothetical protein